MNRSAQDHGAHRETKADSENDWLVFWLLMAGFYFMVLG